MCDEGQEARGVGDGGGAGGEKAEVGDLVEVRSGRGVVLDAWTRANDDDGGDVEEAESNGATFAAAILPYVHACNPSQAEILYNSMRIGSSEDNLDFGAVKTALESVYGCICLICAEVGGVWNAETGAYDSGAEPCDDGNVTVARLT